MEDRLEVQEQIAPPQPDPEKLFEASQALAQLDDINTESLPQEVKDLISRCMDGSEPYGMDLRPWENKKFNPLNVTTVLLKAAGFRSVQIAEILSVTPANVSQVCNHPYAKKILRAMMHRQGSRVIDIKTRMEDYAGELLDKLHMMAMKEEDLKTVAAVGFGLLDRAGYGVVQKVQQEHRSISVTATPENITQLTDALNGSNTVDAHIMPNFSVKPPPDDGGRRVGSTEPPGVAGSGAVGTSPVRRLEPGDA